MRKAELQLELPFPRSLEERPWDPTGRAWFTRELIYAGVPAEQAEEITDGLRKAITPHLKGAPFIGA